MSCIDAYKDDLQGAGSAFILEPDNHDIHPDDQWSTHKAVQDVDLDGYKVTNLANPTQNSDAVNLTNRNPLKQTVNTSFVFVPNNGSSSHTKTILGLDEFAYKCDIEIVAVGDTETSQSYFSIEHIVQDSGGNNYYDSVKDCKNNHHGIVNASNVRTGFSQGHTYYYNLSITSNPTTSLTFNTKYSDNGALNGGELLPKVFSPT